ncbi:MAG: DUF2330 domain-containing protein [Myxococcales bacterium]|nr:DUF2330 domain-containing protein [Myxococcales bacterium]
MLRQIVAATIAAVAITLGSIGDARACGCFAQPSAANPVVQAGERILFAHENDQVIAYIQIKYQGAADQFGWIVPLPSVPTLELGTDALFTMLDNSTLPQYRLSRQQNYCGGIQTISNGGGCSALSLGGDDTTSYAASDMGVASSRDMAAGGVVVEQASIAITLTQVGAVENMGVLVWVAGEARAIPRNYYHVVLDDLPVWFSNFTTYNAELINAVHEAPGKHGFITQYAGSSSLAVGQLDYPGRFGDLTALRALSSPSDYLKYLVAHNYRFDGTLLSILGRYIPEPQQLIDMGVRPLQFYQGYDSYSQYLPSTDPDGGAIAPFDAAMLTDEIAMRIVTPSRDANALLARHPYLTRLYTALSPKDMTIDPVFSSNRELGDVPLLHTATVTTACSKQQWLTTDLGFEVQYLNGLAPNLNLPGALRVELVRDAGPAELVQDNSDQIRAALGPVDHGHQTSPSGDQSSGCGCTVGKRRVQTNVAVLFALCGAGLAMRSLRRRRS